jgi:hypothetical protein
MAGLDGLGRLVLHLLIFPGSAGGLPEFDSSGNVPFTNESFCRDISRGSGSLVWEPETDLPVAQAQAQAMLMIYCAEKNKLAGVELIHQQSIGVLFLQPPLRGLTDWQASGSAGGN